MGRYAIPALSWSARNHIVTFLRTTPYRYIVGPVQITVRVNSLSRGRKRDFQLRMHQKPFLIRTPSGLSELAHSALPDSLAGSG